MTPTRAYRIDMAERRAALVELRRQRVPFTTIVAEHPELGYKTSATARKDFHRALEESIAAQHASVEVYREEQLLELDGLAEEANGVLNATHYIVTPSGKIALDPDTGQPLLDHGPKLAAIDRLVKILDRIAKLRGLDAPTRVEVLTIDAIDAAIADINRQLAARDAEAATTARAEGTPG